VDAAIVRASLQFPQMRRLHPDTDPDHPVDPAELIPEALLGASRGHRPYVVANFISSADGRASVDGGSTGLGDDGDRQIFRALRGCAGAVLAGTGTIGAEHYGTLARDPAVVGLRGRLGLAPQPPLVTITRSGRVPEIPLLADPDSTLIVYAGADVELGDVAATVHVERRDPDGMAMGEVLADLHATHGVRLLLCEGGPSLFGELIVAGLCDELFLTLAPMLAGGDGPSITAGMRNQSPQPLDLLWALGQGESLYLRYALRS
jgi:riboflavin biosynthesis pyrimidine reductase